MNYKYDKKYPALLIKIFESGGGVCNFCVKVKIGRQTFYDWINANPEFAEAYQYAKEIQEALLVQAGQEGMLENPNFNAKIWEIFMRNKCGYTDTRKLKADLTKSKDYNEQLAVVRGDIAKGKLTANEAKALIDVVATGAKIHEVTVLEERISALESKG